MTQTPVAEPSMFCRKCGYALHGLSKNRCPECGLPFDPADPTSFVSATARKASPGAGLGGMLCACILFLS